MEKMERHSGQDVFGWPKEEMGLLPLGEISVESTPDSERKVHLRFSSRYDEERGRIIIRGTDGFVYIVGEIKEKPPQEEVDALIRMASESWYKWYDEQLKKPENIPDPTKLKH